MKGKNAMPPTLSRRAAMLGAGALFAWAHAPARANGRDPRLLVIVLRGALDGLGMIAPVGDPAWPALRGAQGLRLNDAPPALALNDFFALNPAMPTLHRQYQAGQAVLLHAVATPYRARSHFDGQDVLESGLLRARATDSGWLNRALAALSPMHAVRPADGRGRAFAVGPITPLVVRGAAPVLSWAPQRLAQASEDTAARLLDLYRHTDPALAQAMELHQTLQAMGGATSATAGSPGPGNARTRAYFVEVASSAARYLARPDGPRVGALALDGWDTHANEGAISGRLANLLGALDGALAAIEANLGAAWNESVVAVITEFGRTARINGTDGTDHGTGTVALLAGGAVQGGRVIADWPGIAEPQLHEGRDLKPTTDLRAMLKGVLRDHLRVAEGALARSVFPESATAPTMGGLIREG